MQLISFEFKHDCKVSELSTLHPEASIAHWCYSGLELIEIECPSFEMLTRVEDDLAALLLLGFKRIEQKHVKEIPRTVLITRAPSRTGLICSDIEKLGCLPLYPVVYAHGVERYRVVTLQDRNVESILPLISKRGELTITEKRRIDASQLLEKIMISLPTVLSKLTNKQAESLAFAFASGYYATPRRMAMAEVAARKNAKRSTFREHVRKAESKIMGEVIPYMELFPRKTSPPRRDSDDPS